MLGALARVEAEGLSAALVLAPRHPDRASAALRIARDASVAARACAARPGAGRWRRARCWCSTRWASSARARTRRGRRLRRRHAGADRRATRCWEPVQAGCVAVYGLVHTSNVRHTVSILERCGVELCAWPTPMRWPRRSSRCCAIRRRRARAARPGWRRWPRTAAAWRAEPRARHGGDRARPRRRTRGVRLAWLEEREETRERRLRSPRSCPAPGSTAPGPWLARAARERGASPRRRLPMHVVSVGNLLVGGTAKTPFRRRRSPSPASSARRRRPVAVAVGAQEARADVRADLLGLSPASARSGNRRISSRIRLRASGGVPRSPGRDR